MRYGPQVAVVVFGGGLVWRAWVDEYLARGFAIVLCDGYARIHQTLGHG